jgi:phospholipid/cholesterol/gamma-HCH transport system substrate-binding protein
MNKPTVNTLVGALVLAVGVLAFLLSQRGDHSQAVEGYQVDASFGSIDGVAKGTKVLLAGIPVGEVSDFVYNEARQRAILTMTLRDGILIPLDSVVMIVTDGLLGGKYLKIQAGGDTEMMKPGGQFDYTQDSIVFEEILEKVILNAEKTREKEKEAKQKEKEPQEQAPAPNRVFDDGSALRFAHSTFAKARGQR